MMSLDRGTMTGNRTEECPSDVGSILGRGTRLAGVEMQPQYTHLSPEATRFWSKVEQSEGCWLWKGARLPSGYGVFHLSGTNRNIYAHRYAWESANGPIPDGLFVCHHCDNPPCIRPDHLFLGTAKANAEDMVKKGRAKNGPHSKKGTSRPVLADEPLPPPVRVKVPDWLREEWKYDGKVWGERHWKTKLTSEQVQAIRDAHAAGGITNRALGKEYGVHPTTIGYIVSGHSWNPK